jgi:hypothetical protein
LKNVEYLILFPSPLTDELTIQMGNRAYFSFTISNTLGQVLIQQEINSLEMQVNTRNLPGGLYYITFSSEKGNVVKKFVKQ